MHIMELRINEKILLITMRDLMSSNESIEYIEELKTLIYCINPIKYNIVVDTSELKSYPHNYKDFIAQSVELIMNTPFKNSFRIMPVDVLAKTQAKKVINENNISCNTIIVNSYDEVLETIA